MSTRDYAVSVRSVPLRGPTLNNNSSPHRAANDLGALILQTSPHILIRKLPIATDKCLVYLESLSEPTTAVRLRRCNHVLHGGCRAQVAASQHSRCPLCRCKGVNLFEYTVTGPSSG